MKQIPVIVNSCISPDTMLLMPYQPSVEEMEILYADEDARKEFAKRCVLLKNAALPPATPECGDTKETDGARNIKNDAGEAARKETE